MIDINTKEHYEKKDLLEYISEYKKKFTTFIHVENKSFSFQNFDFLKHEEVYFQNCDFLRDIVLDDNTDKYIEFYKCNFHGNFVLFSKSGSFDKELIMRECNFYESTATNIYFNISNTNFEKIIDLRGSKFYRKAYFNNSSFEDNVFFNNCIFYDVLDLNNSIFYEKVKFLNIEIKNGVKNRETARLIKDSFEQQNNVIEANKYYALEMKERERELGEDLKVGKNIFEYFIFKIHGLSSSHSQNAPLALFWILLISFVYSYGFDFLSEEEKYIDILVKNYEQSWMYFVMTSNELFSFLKLTIWMSLPFIVTYFISNYSDKLLCFFIVLFSMFFYMYLTKDFTLSIVANNINPFSIITQDGKLGFAELIYRISIAYLIYQLIISIRQNTRRK